MNVFETVSKESASVRRGAFMSSLAITLLMRPRDMVQCAVIFFDVILNLKDECAGLNGIVLVDGENRHHERRHRIRRTV